MRLARIQVFGVLTIAWFTGALVCGVSCAEAGHDFDRWEPEISAFERQDKTNTPPRKGILFIGSSTIRLWETLARDFPNHRVINRGFGGSQIVDAAHFAERIVFPYAPRMVLLRAGGNDLWAGKTPQEVFEDFREFVRVVHSRLPDAEVVYISLSPSIARWKQAALEKDLNERIAAYVRGKPRLGYVETYSMVLGRDGEPRPELFVEDQLHFSEQGYRLMADRVRPVLRRAGKAPATSRGGMPPRR